MISLCPCHYFCGVWVVSSANSTLGYQVFFTVHVHACLPMCIHQYPKAFWVCSTAQKCVYMETVVTIYVHFGTWSWWLLNSHTWEGSQTNTVWLQACSTLMSAWSCVQDFSLPNVQHNIIHIYTPREASAHTDLGWSAPTTTHMQLRTFDHYILDCFGYCMTCSLILRPTLCEGKGIWWIWTQSLG